MYIMFEYLFILAYRYTIMYLVTHEHNDKLN